MDQETLVADGIEAGKDLVDALRDSDFRVKDAFWSWDEEASNWHLFLVSPYVDRHGPRKSYVLVLATTDQLPSWQEMDPLAVKVIGVGDPISKGIASYMDVNPESPRRFSRAYFHGTHYQDVFVYPRQHDAKN